LSEIEKLLGNQVHIQISGKNSFEGVLTDLGQDILVLYTGEKYLYIPWLHIHRIQANTEISSYVEAPVESSLAEEMQSISYRKILTNAKGLFAEIYVTGNISFHGYITSVLSDYLVFYSPVYKTMFVSLHHLKWLTPYTQNFTPYTLSNEMLPVNPTNTPLLRSLEEQLKKVEGKLVVIDGGGDPKKIGLLKKVDNNLLELVIASGDTVFLKISHIKSVNLP
jgi:hypothetical protein